jgi:hypothetical protein
MITEKEIMKHLIKDDEIYATLYREFSDALEQKKKKITFGKQKWDMDFVQVCIAEANILRLELGKNFLTRTKNGRLKWNYNTNMAKD